MDYSKQKVTELRDECRNRGLDTSGLKAELVARLEQNDQSKGGAAAAPAAAAPAAKGRSQRGAGKGKAEAEPEPEPEAAPPSKKRTISQAIAELKDEGVKKKKTMVKKLDPNCPVAGEVFEDYDCMLNQTNIGQNNNKFYVIQVVKTPGEKYYCYTRWGRVGERGQDANKGPTTKDAAIKEFVSKFKDKTSNQWDNRDSFDPKPGKYTLIEIDHEAEEDQAAKVAALAGDKPPTITKLTVKPSALAPTTQNLMSLIFDTDMFKSAMASFDIDVKKMPLGAISKSQIAKGYEVLLEIEKELKNKASGSVINALSSKFYTLIPHSFGRMVPPPIKDQEMVQKKMDMLNVLGDIEIAQSLQDKINKGKSTTVSDEVDNPLDKNYATLKCDLTPVLPGQEMYEIINTYVKETKGRNVQLIDAFEVNRHGEDKRFDEHKDIKHRKLLWHGTNVAVVAAILSSGLRIMPHSGGRVGKGIYLASENGKSAGYVGCAGNIGIMFLAEATLGKEHSITMDDSSLTRAPPGFDSIVARGRTEPDPAKDIVIKIDGKDVIVPQGKPIPRAEYKNSNFSQSEYLLYKESQVRLRYVLKLKFG